jgi:nucleoside 2-deoxyribosyltransferase
MLAYLCGPIEFAADGGKLWRRKLTPFLRNDLGHRVYDPAEDEKKNLTEEEAGHFREWKETDVERFRRVIRKIIQYDLDIVENKADYVICCLSGDGAVVSSGGTSSELTFAHRRGIPVYLVTEAPLEEISGWILACADHVFRSVEDLKKFLVERYGKEKQTPLWRV